MNIEYIKNMFNKINNLNLDTLFSENKLPDDEINIFAKKYIDITKKLHYEFSNDWDYLKNEVD